MPKKEEKGIERDGRAGSYYVTKIDQIDDLSDICLLLFCAQEAMECFNTRQIHE